MTTSTQLYANNARTLLAVGINNAVTSMVVTTGEGALFPNPTAGQYFMVTLESGSVREIVQVTARSTDTFTIVRAQEGTSAQTWSAGATIECRITRDTLARFARLQDRLFEVNGIDNLTSPLTSDANSYICHTLDDLSRSVVAIRESNTKWSFYNYKPKVTTGTVTAGTNTTTQVTSTNIGTLPTYAAGKYIIQFLSGTAANIGVPRAVTAIGTNTVSWATAMPATVTAGDTFDIYQSEHSILLEKVATGDQNALVYSIVFGG
jgi:hypothetical protein